MPPAFDRDHYDQNNIFAKILCGDIPCDKVHESEHSLAFHDINPVRATHVLVIPKGSYVDYTDFIAKASDQEKIDLQHSINQVIQSLGLDETGFRLITNSGDDGGQEVPHYHVHILGGEKIGPLVSL